MWNILASEINFEIVKLEELRKFLRKSNIAVIDIKTLDLERVIVFYRDVRGQEHICIRNRVNRGFFVLTI